MLYSREMPFLARLEAYFEFQRLGTNWKTEILAGLTTFITMAYIVFVNPQILHEAGMPLAAVTAATCISAAFGSFMMGILARYPIALAPGMGLNAIANPDGQIPGPSGAALHAGGITALGERFHGSGRRNHNRLRGHCRGEKHEASSHAVTFNTERQRFLRNAGAPEW